MVKLRNDVFTYISVAAAIILLVIATSQYFQLQEFREGALIAELAPHDDEVVKLQNWRIINVHQENDVSPNQRLLMNVDIEHKWRFDSKLYATIETLQAGKIIDTTESTFSFSAGQTREIEFPFFLKNEGPQDLKIELLFRNETNNEVIEQRVRHVYDLEVLSFQDKLLRQQNSNMFWSQTGIIMGTVALVLVGTLTLRSTKKFHEKDEKLKHSKEFIPVYESLLYTVCQKNHYEKTLILVIPKNSEDFVKIKYGMLSPREVANMDHIELDNESVEYLDWGIKHLEKYDDIFKKWKKISNIQTSFNNKVSEIMKHVESKTKEKLEHEFPNFVESSGYSHSSYSTNNIVRSMFNMLEDVSHDKEPDTHIEPDYFEQEKMWFVRKDGGTIFEGPEIKDLDEEKIQNVLGCCFGDEKINKKFLELDEFHKEANNVLKDMKPKLEKLIKFLRGGGMIEGKCELGY